jgi:predicted RecB family nuclease
VQEGRLSRLRSSPESAWLSRFAPQGTSVVKSETNSVRLAASDLSDHLDCRHLTTLEYSRALGRIKAPEWTNPDTEVLRQLGMEHERRYLECLTARGLKIEKDETGETGFERTAQAMRQGVDVIVQAVLADGRWFGRADVLRRVEIASELGAWSYEVYDCKLSRETKAATILQLSLYSDLLAKAQGVAPRHMYAVSPSGLFAPESFLVAEYAAYYRLVRRQLEGAVHDGPSLGAAMGEPNRHCDVCRWWKKCDAEWRSADHLSLVAGISRLQRKQLGAWEVATMARLARLPVPLQQRPEYGAQESYVRVREQARVQVEGREAQRLVHETFDDAGLAQLPAPSPGDIFFDFEKDYFVGNEGMEYLFGFLRRNGDGGLVYECRWAFRAEEEKTAFEWFVDRVMEIWAKHPSMHLYHFTAHEPAALKHLMGKYATQEDEVDRILRGQLLVDLHRALKQSVRASVEEYSLKAIEQFYEFSRVTPLAEARRSRRLIEHSLELGCVDAIDDDSRETIEGYNRDDCASTEALRSWLEKLRSERIGEGRGIPRPEVQESAPSEELDERLKKTAALVADLVKDVPVDSQARNGEQSARWLLANLLDWHRREKKAEWWENFRLEALSDEDLLYETGALSGLVFRRRLSFVKGIPTDQYSFEPQETKIRADDAVRCRGQNVGTVVDIDVDECLVSIKKTKKTADMHPASIYPHNWIDIKCFQDSMHRLAEWILQHGVDAPGQYRCGRDLLLRNHPRLSAGDRSPLMQESADKVMVAKTLVLQLDSSVLAIQGPPGSGKTFIGAHLICELVRNGKKVGITGPSHKVIRNLLNAVLSRATEENLTTLQCIQKVSELSKIACPGIREVTAPAEAIGALQDGTANVVGGTAWLWTPATSADAIDVLVIDEAGQMSLANVLTASQAAKSLVLLGDPQQLEQPLKGSHPDGAAVSALDHLLPEGKKTIPPEQGLFLEHTWRLHPEICKFTSEAFYEGRLQAREGLERQCIGCHRYLNGAGPWFVAIKHEGNQNASREEVDVVEALIRDLLAPGVEWFDVKLGRCVPLTEKDVLVIAPYNVQVSNLTRRLPRVRVGTVDKFQGQEAAVVIYSLTTSSPEDAPRGMEFLYSLNRLNVATSRGRALCIVVGSPRLLEPQCRTPRQMQLANALCRFSEMARRIEVRDAATDRYEFVVLPAA